MPEHCEEAGGKSSSKMNVTSSGDSNSVRQRGSEPESMNLRISHAIENSDVRGSLNAKESICTSSTTDRNNRMNEARGFVPPIPETRKDLRSLGIAQGSLDKDTSVPKQGCAPFQRFANSVTMSHQGDVALDDNFSHLSHVSTREAPSGDAQTHAATSSPPPIPLLHSEADSVLSSTVPVHSKVPVMVVTPQDSRGDDDEPPEKRTRLDREHDDRPCSIRALFQGTLDLDRIRRAFRDDVIDDAWLTQLDDDGNCALHYVCGNRSREDPDLVLSCAKIVVKAWQDSVCVLNKDQMLPLHIAVHEDAPYAVVEFLVKEWPLSVVSPDKTGSLPLHLAVANKARLSTVQLLMEHGPKASAKIVNRYGWNPLHSACGGYLKSNDDDIDKYFVSVVRALAKQQRCAIQAKNDIDKDLPLHIACERGAPFDAIKVLVGDDDDDDDDEGKEKTSILRTRLLETRNASGQVALHKACKSPDLSVETVLYLAKESPQSKTIKDKNSERPFDILQRIHRSNDGDGK